MKGNLASADRSEFVRTVDSIGRGIHDPILKLRFLRASLARHQAVDAVLHRVPWAPLRRVLYRWFTVGGLKRLLRSPSHSLVPLDPSTRRSLHAAEWSLGLAGAGLVVAVAAVAFFGMRFWRADAGPVMAAAEVPATAPAGTAEEAAAVEAPVPVPAHRVPAGLRPDGVWLVETGDGWEQYSNGLRIETSHTVPGEKRRYRVFGEDGALLPGVGETPVGILFHTSESDVWPLEASYNENLRDSSARLLRYVRRERLYHYLIDRFGRVYRLVEEEAKANHAGHSVWAHDGRVYLNLNHAFLGVSFETRWEGGRALPLTQAQFAAGHNLTARLRERWGIAPGMCVGHGLTSVNPRKHLIGHHLDWARGFPFAAYGLPDQYTVPPASVALFGFGYDEDFIKVLGVPWSGVRAAEDALEREASRQGRPLAALVREKRALFDRWLQEQAREDRAALGG